MPGKMTVLDRLIKEGRIKQSPFRGMRLRGEFNDPLNYTTHQRISMEGAPELAYMAVPQNGVGQGIKLTPERKVYQKGIEARMQPRYLKADEDVNEAYDEMDAYKDEWNDAVEQAKEDMLSDWQDELEGAATDDPNIYSLEVEPSSTDLRDYWPNYHYREPDEIIDDYDAAQGAYYAAKDVQRDLRSPEAWMQEQTMTPRYRNYQRAMQQRAANMAMGRDLSRRYAIAYNNLLRRGLTPAEARMYMREYFGGR